MDPKQPDSGGGMTVDTVWSRPPVYGIRVNLITEDGEQRVVIVKVGETVDWHDVDESIEFGVDDLDDLIDGLTAVKDWMKGGL
jgi:hypothetical protein